MLTNRDNAIYAYTFYEWNDVEARVLALKSKNISAFKRFFLGNAKDCLCDKQGRILIPTNLRQYSGIEKDIVLVGLVDRFEIWSKERWDAENARAESMLQDETVRNELIDLGL
jgi:MraZ protein